MKRSRKISIVLMTIVVWAIVLTVHGYFHVRSLSGQCCGYEGDPGFLTLFFVVWPGVLYLIGLAVILVIELAVLCWPLPKE